MYSAAKETQAEKVLYLYDSQTYSGMMKLNGIKKGFSEKGKTLKTQVIQINGAPLSDLISRCLEILENNRFDCIFTSSDILAVAVLKASQSIGVSVPKSMKILSYNNSILAKCTTPTLSSIDSQVSLLAKHTFENINSLFNGEAPPTLQLIEASLVHRETF
jgi:LacI family transcriptional regulator/LacI family asc operon transcriptional repressor